MRTRNVKNDILIRINSLFFKHFHGAKIESKNITPSDLFQILKLLFVSHIIFHAITSLLFINTVKPIYKVHSTELENLLFMSSCPLYTG